MLAVPRRRRGARPARLDGRQRLPVALRARARRAGRRLPRDPPASSRPSSASGSTSATRRFRSSTRRRTRRAGQPAACVPLESDVVAGLEGKTAIVTGASSGIGAATARALPPRGRARRRRRPAVDRLETEIALELDVTDPASCERFVEEAVRGARRARHPRQQRRPRARPRSVRREHRGGRGDRARDERERPDPDDAPLPPASARRRPHRQHRLDRRAPGVRERRRLRRPRSSPCAASRTRCARTCSAGRSASRRSTRASSRRTSRACASAATRRRRAPSTRTSSRSRPEDVADCVLFARHAAAARERRRARGQGARPVERRPDRPGRLVAAHDPRRLDLLHLRRARRHRRRDAGPLRRRHALPLALRLTINGAAAAAALVGKVEYFSAAFFLRNPLAGGLPQDALSIIRAPLRRRGHAGPDRRPEPVDGAALVRARARARRPTSRTSSRSRSTTSRSATRCAREPLPPPVGAGYEEEHNQFVLEEPNGEGSAQHPGDLLRSAARSRTARSSTASSSSRARAGSSGSTSSPRSTATRSRRARPSGASARS